MPKKIEISDSPLQFVTWTDSNYASISRAEKRKAALESKGFILVATHPNCLTYVFKPTTESK